MRMLIEIGLFKVNQSGVKNSNYGSKTLRVFQTLRDFLQMIVPIYLFYIIRVKLSPCTQNGECCKSYLK